MPCSGGAIWNRAGRAEGGSIAVDGAEGGGGIWWSAADEAPRDIGGTNILVREAVGACIGFCFEKAEHCIM